MGIRYMGKDYGLFFARKQNFVTICDYVSVKKKRYFERAGTKLVGLINVLIDGSFHKEMDMLQAWKAAPRTL